MHLQYNNREEHNVYIAYTYITSRGQNNIKFYYSNRFTISCIYVK